MPVCLLLRENVPAWGQLAADKGRWSLDGKTIYYVFSRTGFLSIRGRRLYAVRGQPVGEPFQVASFENPGRIIFPGIRSLEISFSQDRLVLPLTEATGNIWMQENVDK
jgi:hypothetical protein